MEFGTKSKNSIEKHPINALAKWSISFFRTMLHSQSILLIKRTIVETHPFN